MTIRILGLVVALLGLGGGVFEVRLTSNETVSASGAESVEFVVAPNTGFAPMPGGICNTS